MTESATVYENMVPVMRRNSSGKYTALRVSIEFIGDLAYAKKRGYWLWVLPCYYDGGKLVHDRAAGNRVLLIATTSRTSKEDKLALVQARVRVVEQARDLCGRYALTPLQSVVPAAPQV